MAKLTAIMLAHNGASRTQRAVQALVRASATIPTELLLVDQASSEELDAPLAEVLPASFPHEILRHETNLPYAEAANRAAASAGGDVLLFLDNDTEIDVDAVGTLLAALEQDASIGSAGPKLMYPSGQIQDAGLALPLWLVPMPIGAEARYDDHRFNFPRAAFALSSSCLMVKRAAFEAVGGFEEGYVWGFESTDFALSLRKRGFRSYFEPRATCIHEGGATLRLDPSLSRTDQNRKHFLSRWGAELLRRVASYLDQLSQDGPPRFLIFGTGESSRHLANTLEIGGYEVSGFLSTNGVRALDRYQVWNVKEVPSEVRSRILIGSPYVREAEDALAHAGLLSGAALPILSQ